MIKIAALDLYASLCLKLLDNKYFDKLRELLEYELSLASSDLQKITLILSIFKKVSAKSDKTDYPAKFLDIIDLVLSKINRAFDQLSDEEYRVATLCVSIITDLLEYQILEHQLTYNIMLKKSALFRSLDL